MGFLEDLRGVLKIPNLMEIDRIVVVSPHPDDAEVGIGGILWELERRGKEVILVVVTKGDMGTRNPNLSRDELASIRKREQEESAKVLGIDELIWLGYEDAGDYSTGDLTRDLVKVFREKDPGIVLTVDPYLEYEFHPDHIKTGAAAARAVLFHSFPHFEGNLSEVKDDGPLGVGFFMTARPNAFFCIDIEKKIEALRKHVSQFSGENLELVEWYLRGKAKELGKTVGCDFAEGIRILPKVALHAFPEVVQI